MSAVAELVSRLVAAGTPPELAAEVVAEAFAAGVVGRQSAEHPVDAATEKRRAYDRERQKKIRELRRVSADNPPMSQPALTLTSSPKDSDSQKEGKKVRARKHSLSADWQPKPEHFEAAEKLKIPRSAVDGKAEDMRIWAGANGAQKLNWDLTFHGFLRRDAAQLAGKNNGHGRPTVQEAAARNVERMRGLRDGLGTFDLRGGAGESNVRLLPPRGRE